MENLKGLAAPYALLKDDTEETLEVCCRKSAQEHLCQPEQDTIEEEKQLGGIGTALQLRAAFEKALSAKTPSSLPVLGTSCKACRPTTAVRSPPISHGSACLIADRQKAA